MDDCGVTPVKDKIFQRLDGIMSLFQQASPWLNIATFSQMSLVPDNSKRISKIHPINVLSDCDSGELDHWYSRRTATHPKNIE